MTTLIHERVDMCRAGTNPKTICRVNSGWVVIGDVQFLSGYCLILPDPVVSDLNALSLAERDVFLREVSILGDALLAVTNSYRINYEILGNSEAALHAHVFPRYLTEAEEFRTRPAWFYDWQAATPFDPKRDAELMRDIKTYLISASVTVETAR